VIAAHDHNYQRFAKRDRVTYVLHGGGGAGLYSLNQCPRWFPRRVEAHKTHGWLYLRTTADSLRVRAIGRRGRVQDRFELELPTG
jgi:hypothetical protein